MYARVCRDGECQSGCTDTMFWQGPSEDGHANIDRGPSLAAALTPAVIPQLSAKPLTWALLPASLGPCNFSHGRTSGAA
jgi:hypothetical protein